MKRIRAAAMAMAMAMAVLAAPAGAWNDLGHEVIALMAYRTLTPAARQKVDAILAADPRGRTLLLAAVWPDRHRTHPGWHYVNIPYHPGRPLGRIPAAEGVLTAIRLREADLGRPGLSPEDRAGALADLVHFVGDCHQPMHSVARFTAASPDGDRGGNDVLLRGRFKNLHVLWDCALDLQEAKPPSWQVADALMRQYPASRFRRKLRVTDPDAWARESSQVAVRRAYALPEGGPTRPEPTNRYLHAVERAARERVALAGYRLAAALERALGSAPQ